MRRKEPFPIVFLIFLPFVAALAMNLAPRQRAEQIMLQDGWQRQAAVTSGKAVASEKTDQSFEQLVVFEPWRGDMLELLGDNKLAEGQVDKAILAYQQALNLKTLSMKGMTALGDSYQQKGQAAQAIQLWQKALTAGGDPDVLAMRIANEERRMQDYAGEMQTLHAWQTARPKNAWVPYEMGLLQAASQPQMALAMLKQSGEIDYVYAIKSETLQNAIQQALQHTDLGYQQVSIGRALSGLGEWDLAEQAFQQATLSDPDYAEAWAFLGEALQQTGQDGSADLQKALQLNPASVVAQTLWAVQMRQQGRDDVALVYLHEAAEEEPGQGIWQVEMGNILAEMGDTASALDHFNLAVQIEPNNAVFWQDLALFCASNQVELRETGLPAARQALLLDENSATGLDTMGVVLHTLGDLTNAEKFLQRSLQADRSYAPGYLHLGQVYLDEGRPDLAYAPLIQAARLSGKNDLVGVFAKRLLDQNYNTGG
ncbi:MAG TPA: tetratricopeptide repeat protein [Anaerolineaceae bacterium]|nr:tetratricopeptide repeat protein [Anaerolineaceae bacterium]